MKPSIWHAEVLLQLQKCYECEIWDLSMSSQLFLCDATEGEKGNRVDKNSRSWLHWPADCWRVEALCHTGALANFIFFKLLHNADVELNLVNVMFNLDAIFFLPHFTDINITFSAKMDYNHVPLSRIFITQNCSIIPKHLWITLSIE